MTRRERRRVVVVFDGAPPPGASYGPDVVYSGRESADSVILGRLRAERDPKGGSSSRTTASSPIGAGTSGPASKGPVRSACASRTKPEGEKPEEPGDVWTNGSRSSAARTEKRDASGA